MRLYIILILLFFITTSCLAQGRVIGKAERIICEGDTFYKKTIINKRFTDDTIYTFSPYHPYKPEKCLLKTNGVIFKYVEHMPEPKYDLDSYFVQTIKYPTEFKKLKINGEVAVRFLVSAKGAIQQIKVIESLHPTADSLAISAIANMPNWTPGYQNGEPVAVLYAYRIPF